MRPRTGRITNSLRGSRLARFLLAAYLLLAVYASLFPFSGWRDPGGFAAALRLPWPKFITAFDVAANFFGYVPYGLLWMLAFVPPLRSGVAAAAALGSAAVLSISLEALQGFLPARIPSSLDVAMNVAGAAAGAAAGFRLAPWLKEGPFQRARAALFVAGPSTDLGLTLLGLWLFAQLNPAALAFGTGDLRDLLAAAEGAAHRAHFFVAIEAVTCAANLLAVALLASAMTNPGARVRALIVGLVLAGVAVKALAFAILLPAEQGFAWLTPGAWAGLAAGTLLALGAVGLGRTMRLGLAAVLLMAATVMLNVAPPNPYLSATLKVWAQGHFLNFNGLTRLVSAAWPFAALAYLIYLASARNRETTGG